MVICEAAEVLYHGQTKSNRLSGSRARFADDITSRQDVVVGHRLIWLVTLTHRNAGMAKLGGEYNKR